MSMEDSNRNATDGAVVIFTESDVFVVTISDRGHRGAHRKWVARNEYERWEDDHDLAIAQIPVASPAMESLGVPRREVEPGTVLVEADGIEEGDVEEVVVACTSSVTVVASLSTRTGRGVTFGPGGSAIYEDAGGSFVAATLPVDTMSEWWDWAEQTAELPLYPSLGFPGNRYTGRLAHGPLTDGDSEADDQYSPGVHRSDWIATYNGPERHVRLMASRGDGEHHWSSVTATPWPHPDSPHVALLDDDGAPRWLEIRLDADGAPIDPPPDLNGALFGSPTLWPRGDITYVWYFEDEPLLVPPRRNAWFIDLARSTGSENDGPA